MSIAVSISVLSSEIQPQCTKPKPDIEKLFGQQNAATPANGSVQLFSYSHGLSSAKNSSVQLLNNVSLGNFRALTVSSHSLNALTSLMMDQPNVLSIVPDVELTFDLPKPKSIGNGYRKRALTKVHCRHCMLYILERLTEICF